jgi:DNA repair protein RadC
MKTKVNEIAISYRGEAQLNELPKINCSKDAADLLFENWDADTIGLQESFKIVLLNNANRVKGIYLVSTGGITGTLVDLRIVFAVVLKSLSTALILSHCHPSGTLRPSEADKKLTEKIKMAASYLGVKLLDHLIIVPNGTYSSFADEAIL